MSGKTRFEWRAQYRRQTADGLSVRNHIFAGTGNSQHMQSARSLSAVFAGAIVALLAGVLLWGILGVAIESSGIVIYDDFPSKPGPLSGQPVSVSVNNNAPMVLPYVTPTYDVSVIIISNSSAIEC